MVTHRLALRWSLAHLAGVAADFSEPTAESERIARCVSFQREEFFRTGSGPD